MMNQQIETKSSNFFATYILSMWLVSIFIREYSNSDFLIIVPWLLLAFPLIIYKKKIGLKVEKLQAQSLFLLLYLFGITAINRVISTETIYSYFRLLSEIFFLLIVPTILITIYCNNFPGLQESFFRQYSILMTICSGLGLIEYVFKFQPYTWLIQSSAALENFNKYSNVNSVVYRASLFFYHPIYYGMFVTMALVIISVLPFRNKFLQIGSYIILISGILLSKSRTCWLALLFVAILYALKKRSIIFSRESVRRGIFWLFGFLLVVFVFLRTPIMKSILDSMFNRIDSLSGSNVEYGARLANLSLPRQIAEKKSWLFFLFGGGMGYGKSYLMAHPSINNWTEAIDNQFLTLFIDTGIVGLLIYIGILFTVVKSFFNRTTKISELACLLIILSLAFSATCDIIVAQSVFYLITIFIGLSSKLEISG